MSASEAVRAATSVARAHGLRVSSPVVLRSLSNTLIWLRPAPVVARVAAATALVRSPVDFFERDLAVSAYLAARGVPVVTGSSELPPGPHAHSGFTMTFTQYVPHDLSVVPSPASFASLLASLHAELAHYSGPLPLAMPFDDMAALGCAVTVRPAGRVARPLHGDAHPGNLLWTPAGPVWNDFEDTWLGPVEWDLACLLHTRRLDGAAAMAAYPGAYSPSAVSEWLTVRRAHAACWTEVLNG